MESRYFVTLGWGAGLIKHGFIGSRKSFYAADCAYLLVLFLRMVRAEKIAGI